MASSKEDIKSDLASEAGSLDHRPAYIPDVDNELYIPDLEFTPQEERRIVRSLDFRLFSWVLFTTFILNMDRTNHSNAVSDNLPEDLGFTINVVNTGVALYSAIFSCACIVGAVMAKIVGPHRWIAGSMFAWGLVTMAHALVKDKAGYLTVRCLIALTEGGTIPATLVYLGAFYKNTELAVRLGWFWGVQVIANAVSGLMASGLLQLRGVSGLEGWKWLFLVDGIITVVAAVATWFYLPKDVSTTKGGIRGFKPWFDQRQVFIGVTRIVKDDPSKKIYEQRVKWADVKDAATDIGLIGHLLITTFSMTPTTPLGTYLPRVIKLFHFDVFVANALTAPPYILQFILTLIMIHNSDRLHERGLHGAFGSLWMLAGWILLRCLPSDTSRGIKYFAALLVASWPYTHPLNVAWMSANTGSIGKRTLGSGAIIFAANILGVWGSQIYQAKDSPDFRVGNTINIVFTAIGLCLFVIQKYIYEYRNKKKAAAYAQLSEEKKAEEDAALGAQGNTSLAFRFTT
ncbi:MFS general substrate transporter [Cylindrobasidium torrendii FP15055 ss-10]|uniref:MFS general substrate transporter n=1 Tax=Cylindrobasidium torrendii FP15055 ss-10 TaxID=1314674 RepID=A0A0D7BFF3_9AGAR|nr:MFS general substrate transporter [Cylindrobasidium torrendii FP15055 ss-10]